MYINLNNNNSRDFKDNNNFIKEIRNFLSNKNLSQNSLYSVDRFINNFAICENLQTGEFINIPLSLLSQNVKTGDILKLKNNKFIIDKDETKKAKEEIKDLANSLFKRRKNS